MDCVWDLGEVTGRQVIKRLDGQRPLAYTTTQTIVSLRGGQGRVGCRRRGRPLVAHGDAVDVVAEGSVTPATDPGSGAGAVTAHRGANTTDQDKGA